MLLVSIAFLPNCRTFRCRLTAFLQRSQHKTGPTGAICHDGFFDQRITTFFSPPCFSFLYVQPHVDIYIPLPPFVHSNYSISHAIQLEFTKPGTQTKNAYIKCFNCTYRDEILNMHVFSTLTDARELTADWEHGYNEERPHDSLHDLTPWEYLAQHELLENSNLGRH